MRKRNIHKLLSICSILLLLIACGNKDRIADEIVRGSKSGNIVETGELAAVNSKAFVLERYGRYWYQMRIIGILEHGTIVQPGDSIIQLDPTEIQKSIIDWESSYETQLANYEKLLVDQDIRRNELLSNLKNEEASFELKKIELEASKFETERFRKIKALEFRQAEIAIEKARRSIDLNEIMSENDLKIQKIRLEQLKTQIESGYDILSRLTIRTSIGGVFQIERNFNGQMYKVSDQVYPGYTMASVPQLEYMKVNTQINETDFLKIKKGQKVAVRLDAMPNIIFDAEVAYIGKLCHLKDYNSKSRQKIFDVEVMITKPDERLKPGMTVSCEYLN